MQYMVHTQKSISKLPLPPNSRSPTWNETVIKSSLCSISWKHSREWAFSWMLWAAEAPIQPSMVTRTVDAEKRILKTEFRLITGVSINRRNDFGRGGWEVACECVVCKRTRPGVNLEVPNFRIVTLGPTGCSVYKKNEHFQPPIFDIFPYIYIYSQYLFQYIDKKCKTEFSGSYIFK